MERDVFLSAFTTKTAVYVLLRGFPGTELLIYVGLAMVFYGIIYALLENDMRRILAYSIVNQVGFMVTGIGIGTEMALNGAAAHAFTHILYKALLLMSAGSVLLMTARRKCTDLGGLFRSMPLTATCGIIGALAISSFPLTSGFEPVEISKRRRRAAFVVWDCCGCLGRGVPARRIKGPGRVLPEGYGLRRPSAVEHAARHGLPRAVHRFGGFFEKLYACCLTRDYEPYTGFQWLRSTAAAVFRLGVFRDARMAAPTLTIS